MQFGCSPALRVREMKLPYKLALLIGVWEIYLINKYGLYPIPYTGMFFVGVGVICDEIRRLKNNRQALEATKDGE